MACMFGGKPAKTGIAAALAISCVLALSGCNTQKVLSHGAMLTDTDIQLIPVGSSKEQVLLALGTPSTTGTFDNEVYYYISQKQVKNFEFQKPSLVDQRVVAVYFGGDDTVERVADYRLEDGRVFDFISRTTPTGGKDLTFLQRIFASSGTTKPTSLPQSSPNTRPGL